MDPFYLALLLYVLAIVLAAVDLFIPSGGMLLVVSVLAALASVLFGFRSGTTMGMSMLTVVVASIPTFAFAAVKLWPLTPIGRRAILKAPVKILPDAEEEIAKLRGRVLITRYPLMPSGSLRIDGKSYRVTMKSGVAEVGQRIKIVGEKERTLIVERTEEPCTPALESNAQLTAENQDLLELPANELGLDSLDSIPSPASQSEPERQRGAAEDEEEAS